MTDNEMILAMSNLLEPIKDEIQEMREDIREIRGDIREVRGDIQEIKGRVKKIEMTQENIILPRLDNIEACYVSTYERYKDNVEGYETMKQDVSLLKKVVAEHSGKLQMIS